jgi:tRNA G26 N,N-dimethylase Trm1
VTQTRTDLSRFEPSNKRSAERRPLMLPARLTWKDHRGATRFASVITRNVSEYGVFVECQTSFSIPMYRLVQFQLEREVRDSDPLPESLRRGRVLSAVYRVTSVSAASGRQGLALRLMVDPKRRPVEIAAARATA